MFRNKILVPTYAIHQFHLDKHHLQRSTYGSVIDVGRANASYYYVVLLSRI